MLLVWDANAWEDYLWWQAQDRKVLKRINLLIRDVQRNGNNGIGKPEPLKHDFAGYWSRRITDEHRLVYKLTDTRSASRLAGTTTGADKRTRFAAEPDGRSERYAADADVTPALTPF